MIRRDASHAPKAAYYASSNAYLSLASIANPNAASSDSTFFASQTAEARAQTELLRCIFGPLPFRRVSLDATGLAWEGSTTRKLAEAIYDERAFDHLPILADALEDAGCADADLLGHLRGPGLHVRGCWALDALLAKE